MNGLANTRRPIFVVLMRNHIDISLARFLMIFSLLLLGILEYLWLHNEYKNAYRNMEDKLTHVMFSSMRDVEDSLIFSRLTLPSGRDKDCDGPLTFSIVMNTGDSVQSIDHHGGSTRMNKEQALRMPHSARACC
ncbi:MAG: hypothetical protein IPL92_04110 [Saprospiraceae bacterium]|nr:hypothetical protein [Candidatus Opimibacter iunctus]